MVKERAKYKISRGGEGDLGSVEVTDDFIDYGKRIGMIPENCTDSSLDVNNPLNEEIIERYKKDIERAHRITGERLNTRINPC